MNRMFLVTSAKATEGVIFSYNATTGLFCGIDILQKNMTRQARHTLVSNILLELNLFLSYVKELSQKEGYTVVELGIDITFEMFWDKYNDKLRSSKKRSEKIWNKLKQEDKIKAFYHINTYNKYRGNAEKKYAETYLNAELWNN